MGKVKLLTREEEAVLGRKVQEGLSAAKKLEEYEAGTIQLTEDEIKDLEYKVSERLKAREVFFEKNKGLVHKIAIGHMKKIPSSMTEEELFHEGIFGLYRAVDKFNPDLGNKFSTMAYYWISLSISRAFNNTYRMVRLPENRITDYTKIGLIAKELDKPINDKAVKEKAQAELGISDEYYSSILAAAPAHASLDFKISSDDDSNSTTLADLISVNKASDSAEETALSSYLFKSNFIDPVMELPEVEREIISVTTGIDIPGCYLENKKQLKEKYSITDKDINKRYNSFISSLRETLKDKGYTYQDFQGAN